MSYWYVTVEARCRMLVLVEADTEAQAKRVAKEGDYEPQTDWEEWGSFRPISAHKTPDDFTPLAGLAHEEEA